MAPRKSIIKTVSDNVHKKLASKEEILDQEMSEFATHGIQARGFPEGHNLLENTLAKKQKTEEASLSIPVLLTFVIKHINDGRGDYEKEAMLTGTLLHRTIGFDMQDWEDTADESHNSSMFRIRVNEESAEEFFEIRKSKMAELKNEDGAGLGFSSREVTCNANIPTIRFPVFDEKPFFICAIVCTLELSSSTRKLGDREVTLLPDLWSMLTDQRALVHTKDKSDFDRCRYLDPVSYSPTIEYFAELRDGYPLVQKVRITYYLESEWLKNMFEYLLPILFCNIATTFMYVMLSKEADKTKSFDDLVPDLLAVGLTVVFLMPALCSNDNFDGSAFSTDTLFVMLVMLSLICGLCPHVVPILGPNGFVGADNEADMIYQWTYSLHIPGLMVTRPIPLSQYLSIVFSWAALVIPVSHVWLYISVKNAIKDKADPEFIGKPKRSDTPFQLIQPFTKKSSDNSGLNPQHQEAFANKKLEPNMLLEQHPQFKNWTWKSTGKKTVTFSRGRTLEELQGDSGLTWRKKCDYYTYAGLIFAVYLLYSMGEYVPRENDTCPEPVCQFTDDLS